MTATRSRKGLLLTLISIIMLILLVGELTTYELINIDYSQIASQSAISLSSINLASELNGALQSYLQSALPQAIAVIAANAPSLLPSMTANVAVFSSSSTYITVSNSVTLSPISQMSMFAWVRPSGSTAIAQKQGSYGMNIGIGGGAGQFNGYIGSSSSTCSSYPYSMPNTTWGFVGFTYNGSVINEYVNGQLYCSATKTGSIPVTSNSLAMGGSADSDGSVYGYLSNVQLYNTALPSASVALLYSKGPIGNAIQNSSLAGWWPLNGNANDYSGNGNNGAATGISYVRITSNATASRLVSKLIMNGTLFGTATNMSGSSLSNFVSALKNNAALRQLSLAITNDSLSVYQYSMNRIGVTYTAFASVISTMGNYSVPISATATLSTAGSQNYISAQSNSSFWNSHTVRQGSASSFSAPLIACTNNYVGGQPCSGSVTYTTSSALTGNLNVSGNVVINSGVSLTLSNHYIIARGTFSNAGSIVAGFPGGGGGGDSPGTSGASLTSSYGGSGGGGSGCNWDGGNGGSTLVAGGASNNPGPPVAGSTPSAPTISNSNIQLWSSNFNAYLGGAGGGGGGTGNGGAGSGGSGSYGVYIQAQTISAGSISSYGAGGGNGASSGGGGGGGGVILLAYGSGGYTAGSYAIAGGPGGSSGGAGGSGGYCGAGASGGAGRVVTYQYTTQPLKTAGS